jgi:cytochrome c553
MKTPLALLPSLLFSLLCFVGLPSTATAQNAQAGQKKAAMCIGCHGIPGYQASFPEVHKVPMIAGQNAAYIVSSLLAYQKGERLHPTMRGIAASLTEADMADLGAFYSTQPAATGQATVAPATVDAPSPRVAELLKKANCVSCHGANLSKPIAPNYPKIAGQHPDYLYVALKAYQTDGNAQVGRKNAIMGGMAKQYTHAELKEMAKYIGSLPGELHSIPESRWR